MPQLADTFELQLQLQLLLYRTFEYVYAILLLQLEVPEWGIFLNTVISLTF